MLITYIMGFGSTANLNIELVYKLYKETNLLVSFGIIPLKFRSKSIGVGSIW